MKLSQSSHISSSIEKIRGAQLGFKWNRLELDGSELFYLLKLSLCADELNLCV